MLISQPPRLEADTAGELLERNPQMAVTLAGLNVAPVEPANVLVVAVATAYETAGEQPFPGIPAIGNGGRTTASHLVVP